MTEDKRKEFVMEQLKEYKELLPKLNPMTDEKAYEILNLAIESDLLSITGFGFDLIEIVACKRALTHALHTLRNRSEHWIHVSKELPKERFCEGGYVEPSAEVVVTGEMGSVGIARYLGNRTDKSAGADWIGIDWGNEKVETWCPITSPNQKEEQA